MQDQPKLKDVGEVLDRLDRNWQVLVQLFQEGQGKPATPVLDSVKPGSQDAAGDHLSANAPPLDVDADNHCVRRSTPNSLPPGKPGAGTLHPNCVLAPKLEDPQTEQLPRKGSKQKFFNVSILVLLGLTLGGLSFLMAQTQLGRGRVDTGTLTIRGQDGAPRAWLGERDGQISLCLLDKAGRSRVKVYLDPSGNPSLSLLDELQQNRAEMKMGPGGEPLLSQVKEPAQPATNEEQALPTSDQKIAAAPVPENPDLKKPSPVSTSPETPGEAAGDKTAVQDSPVKYVGSKTSNKYHFPGCRWAKMILPKGVLGFKSVEQAKADGYIPCRACKPPLTDNTDSQVSK